MIVDHLRSANTNSIFPTCLTDQIECSIFVSLTLSLVPQKLCAATCRNASLCTAWQPNRLPGALTRFHLTPLTSGFMRHAWTNVKTSKFKPRSQKTFAYYLPLNTRNDFLFSTALQDLATSGVDMVEIKFQKSFCYSVIAWRNRANLKASPVRLHQISRVILRIAPCAARTASDSLLMQISSSCESNKISLQTLMAPSSTSTLQRVSWILEQQERPGWGMK